MAKPQKRNRDFSISEALLNGLSGYGSVILGLISFILFLAIVMALTRFVVGASLLTPATNATNSVTTQTPARPAS